MLPDDNEFAAELRRLFPDMTYEQCVYQLMRLRGDEWREDRDHNFRWIMIATCWTFDVVAIWGLLSGKLNACICACLLSATAGVLIGITPAMLRYGRALRARAIRNVR